MKTLEGIACLAGLLMTAVPRAWSDPASGGQTATKDSAVVGKEELAARYPELDANDIDSGPLPGTYEVVVGSNVMYVTTDGRFLIRGEIVDLTTQSNLTAARRAAARATLLATIDPATEIVFSPMNGNVKHRVTIFTDVDCGYCRQFHRDIAAVNALGIEVRYVSYPRTGPDTESWAKAEGVWCAADRKAALTQAKLGGEVAKVAGCTTTPVAAQYELGRRIGLTGTPGLYAESGEELGGYLPPDQLLAALKQIDRKK